MNGRLRLACRRIAAASTAVPLIAGLIALSGCETTAVPPGSGGSWDSVPPEISVDGRPVALINGAGVPWEALRPRLLEASGAEALADWILEQRLEAALLDAGIRVSPAMIEAEQDELLARIADDPDDSARVLAELRDRRNLGPARFTALLRRNAGLRALVAPSVAVSTAQVRAAFDIAHGPRQQVRLLTASSLSEATKARARIAAGEASFAEVATAESTDLSAARGGLLEPFSELDPALPDAIRRAAFALKAAGELSPPLLLADGAALLQLVRTVDGDETTWEDGRLDAERSARLAAERVAMERAARDLVADSAVTILDPSLRDAWDRRRRRTTRDR